MAPPRRCSGDMYGSVPSTAAVSVSRVIGPVSISASRRAMPKSASCAPSAPSSTFAGLRSRWTTPRSCAWASAANSAPNTAAVSAGGSGPRRDARAQIAALDQRHREPRRAVLRAVRQHAHDRRMLEAREQSISRAKRATTSGLSASAGARNLSATIVPSGAAAR